MCDNYHHGGQGSMPTNLIVSYLNLIGFETEMIGFETEILLSMFG